RRSLAGSLIGGIPETQEMLDFCAEHGIVADIEMIRAEQINEAYDRMLKGDGRYRFVLDHARLAGRPLLPRQRPVRAGGGRAMSWILSAVSALMFGLYNVFIKLSSDHIHAVLGAVVLQFVAAFMGLAWLLYLMATQSTSPNFTGRGITIAALAGVAIGLVEI